MEGLYLSACGLTEFSLCHPVPATMFTMLDHVVAIVGTWQVIRLLTRKG